MKSEKTSASRMVEAGRSHAINPGPVNPPIVRASTFLFDTLADFQKAGSRPFDGAFYGRVGTPTTFAFEDAICEIEGGHRSIATASGLAAISATLLACLEKGDHLLMVDTVYDPARRFANRTLKRMGVDTTFYDPALGDDIASLIRPETKLIYLESPGTGTFEVQDIAAIVRAAKKAGVRTAIDATWATPLLLRPLEHGIDISIHAATKYIVGHSDAMLGVVTANAETYDDVRRATQDMGASAGIEECNLGLRGLRTLELRLRRHEASALELARWLEKRPDIAKVYHPALPGAAGHEFWSRDFDGASGVFSVELHKRHPDALRSFVDALDMFRIGFSWGGFESLVLPAHPETRTLPLWNDRGPIIRLQIGLEDVDDLRADLERALDGLQGLAE
ncbi:cystathionine beta-lyase [Jiella mangrovi]|uniref:Cystathionine beta-lyase n=1 Tax=Jiella mangrovi TaxID=2821407 RepID=A0ABS4BJU0_9HYPH|nr:cystathionine beta-lyase [Jiella mangrovi]MBP0617024.1 cystathionine beta-lyase [Jiella mangrovi]